MMALQFPVQQPGRARGFTLFELLIVIVIVAILFTYTTLAIRGNSPEDLIKEEAHRLEKLVELALEESVLRGEEYAMEINQHSYRFLHFVDNQWLPLEQDKILRQRELPNDMELDMRLEDTEIIINPGSDLMSKDMLDFNNDSDTEAYTDDDSTAEEEDETKAQPQIFLLSSGEITPEFDIRFYILGVEASYLVKGYFDGRLETELSDL